MTQTDRPRPFRYDAEVPPGKKRQFRYPVSETYLGDPVEVPVTVVNGDRAGPTVFLSAAVHGDELNGVKVIQEVADAYDPADLCGALVCLHVLNVPGYLAQTRDIPIYDQDLNRAFPGKGTSTTAERMAATIYDRFVSQCDYGIDFHTSTRNRTTMYHARAATDDPEVARLAEAFGANVVLSGEGDEGSLRKAATDAGVPTVTVEMGKAHRFQPALIDRAVAGVESVLAEFGVLPDATPSRPAWTRVISGAEQRRWIRADTGGLVEMRWGPYPLVYADETLCTVTDHFKKESHAVTAPFTGLVVGVLENPVALPGHPLVHFVRMDDATAEEIAAEIERGEFEDYRPAGAQFLADGEGSE